MTRRLIGLLAACLGAGACAATLNVEVVGAKNDQGHVAVAVFAAPEGFPKDDGRAIRRLRAPIDAARRSSTVTLADLPAGEYAVSVFHDDDDSGVLETNFFGLPLKGYGFSNNPRPAMRAARFEEARFALPETGRTIRVELGY
jgi:uncharacterized protein (DUF2141 family)